MKFNRNSLVLALAAASLVAGTRAGAQSVFTAWNFDNLTSGATSFSPAASTGTGTALSIGMTSSTSGAGSFPTAGATGPDTSNIFTLQGTDTGSVDGLSNNTSAANLTWRIVGTNGWNSAAAIGAQGAQFSASTVGEQNITASFDLEITSQGESSFQAQYTINGTTWLNAPLTFAGAAIAGNGGGSVLTNSLNANIVNGTYFQATASGKGTDQWFDGFTVNLSAISAVNNDPTFGFRIVNAATGTAVTNVSQLAALNNTSGNWRLDDVTFSGTAIPEPSTWALIAGCVVLGSAMLRRRFARA
jgi:hypothetical protein